MELIDEKIDKIKNDYNFVGSSFDKQGNFIGNFYYYSIVINLFPSEVEKLKIEFPNFNVTHLYSDFYIIGFNKKIWEKN